MRICPKCGETSEFDDAEYCIYCGTYLINHCTNQYCDMNNGQQIELNPQARYCELCGHTSSFFEEGLLSDIFE